MFDWLAFSGPQCGGNSWSLGLYLGSTQLGEVLPSGSAHWRRVSFDVPEGISEPYVLEFRLLFDYDCGESDCVGIDNVVADVGSIGTMKSFEFQGIPWCTRVGFLGEAPDPLIDECGNKFILDCIPGFPAFYCVTYEPASGGPAVMVSKCAWGSGSNIMEAFGTLNEATGNAHIFKSFRHLSVDTRVDDLCGSDDPNGEYIDEVDQQYDALRDRVRTAHVQEPRCSGPVRQAIPKDNVRARTGCEFDHYFPREDDLHWCAPCDFAGNKTLRDEAPPDSGAMTVAEATIAFRGTPAGGQVSILVVDAQASVTTQAGETIGEVVQAVANAINNSSDIQQRLHSIAQAQGDTLRILGVHEMQLAMEVTDPGMVQPPSPTGLFLDFVGDNARLSWTSPIVYDQVYATKSGGILGHFRGTAGETIDIRRTATEPRYVVVGWKDGAPSRAAVLAPPEISLEVEPDPIIRPPSSPWVLAHIEVPSPLKPEDIYAPGVSLNNVFSDTSQTPIIGDWDGDGTRDLSLAFEAVEVLNTLPPGSSQQQLRADGRRAGELFTASDTVQVTDVNAVPNEAPGVKGSGFDRVTPNPSRSTVTMSYSVSARAKVSLQVVDASGRHVVTLVEEEQEAGAHSVRWNLNDAGKGVYFARLRIGGAFHCEKLVIL